MLAVLDKKRGLEVDRALEQDIPGDQVSPREIFCNQYGVTVWRLVEGQELKVTVEIV